MTTMYAEVTRTIGIASHSNRVSAFSQAMITTNPTPIHVVISRKAINFVRMTWGTETGTVAR